MLFNMPWKEIYAITSHEVTSKYVQSVIHPEKPVLEHEQAINDTCVTSKRTKFRTEINYATLPELVD